MLIDDHQVVMAGCEHMLEAVGIKTVAKISDPRMVVAAYDQYRPDVVVLDIRFGEGLPTGIEIARQLLDPPRTAKILVFSQSNQYETIQECYSIGVLAFLTKDSAPDEFEKAILKVANGEQYLGEQAGQRLIAHMNRSAAQPSQLTDQESAILELVCTGKTLKAIGAYFGHSNRWAHSAVAKIKQKLDVKETADLIRVAVELKMVEARDKSC